MKKGTLLALGLLGLSLTTALAAQQAGRTMSIEEINSGAFASRSAGRGMRSMSDGLHYTMMDKAHKAILRYSFATGQLVDTLFSVSSRPSTTISSSPRGTTSSCCATRRLFIAAPGRRMPITTMCAAIG